MNKDAAWRAWQDKYAAIFGTTTSQEQPSQKQQAAARAQYEQSLPDCCGTGKHPFGLLTDSITGAPLVFA